MVLPTVTFTIPSLQDQIELECRIYRPPASVNDAYDMVVRGVAIAHPYANLGGCFDDPAILAAADTFLEQGYVVGTFNFRGAGGSKGSTSWTGLPELADYVSFIGFFIHFLRGLNTPSSRPLFPPASYPPPPSRVSLVLAGYSYGSRILTHVPSVSSIIDRFQEPRAGSTEAIVTETARCLAERELAELRASQTPDLEDEDVEGSPLRTQHSVHVGGSDGQRSPGKKWHQHMGSPHLPSTARLGKALKRSMESLSAHRRSRTNSSGVSDFILSEETVDHHTGEAVEAPPNYASRGVDLRFLLISPVLPPMGWFISPRLDRPSAPSDDQAGVKMTVAGLQMDVTDDWWHYPSLVVFGDDDQFTSAKKIRQWTENMTPKEGLVRRVRAVELHRQGHFWHTHESEESLRTSVRDWLVEDPAGRPIS